jgi:hypothetical protein
MWKVEGVRPYESKKGIGTADLYIEGQILIGDFTVYGKFDLLLNRPQEFPLSILAGSKVEVGDSREQLVVKEDMDN